MIVSYNNTTTVALNTWSLVVPKQKHRVKWYIENTGSGVLTIGVDDGKGNITESIVLGVGDNHIEEINVLESALFVSCDTASQPFNAFVYF